MMLRPRNWDIALAQWARSIAGSPFVWGETDCGSLVRYSLKAVHGRDMLAREPKYKTLLGAKRAAAKTTVASALESVGANRLPWSVAQAGDVALFGVGVDGWDSVGIVLDEYVLMTGLERGVFIVRRIDVTQEPAVMRL